MIKIINHAGLGFKVIIDVSHDIIGSYKYNIQNIVCDDHFSIYTI